MAVLVNPDQYSPEELREISRALGKGKYPRRSKFNAVKTILDGHRFDSKKEAECWTYLKARERAGEIEHLERQVRFKLFARGIDGSGHPICTYVADFRFFDKKRGYSVVADAKGVKTALFNLKAKMLKANYGIEVELM